MKKYVIVYSRIFVITDDMTLKRRCLGVVLCRHGFSNNLELMSCRFPKHIKNTFFLATFVLIGNPFIIHVFFYKNIKTR